LGGKQGQQLRRTEISHKPSLDIAISSPHVCKGQTSRFERWPALCQLQTQGYRGIRDRLVTGSIIAVPNARTSLFVDVALVRTASSFSHRKERRVSGATREAQSNN